MKVIISLVPEQLGNLGDQWALQRLQPLQQLLNACGEYSNLCNFQIA